MTENTFISGEGATVAPVAGETFREMYLPPNSSSNASFLETLRVMLVHETEAGVQLGYGTPRSWLSAGKRIDVRAAATTFGPASFTLTAHAASVDATVTPPPAGDTTLRLRLPAGKTIASVSANGRAYTRVDRATATLDLGGLHGRIELRVRLGTS